MAKRKASKSSDQSELPLGDTPPAAPQAKSAKPAGRGKKAEVKRQKSEVGGRTSEMELRKSDVGAEPEAGTNGGGKIVPPEIASQTSGADAPASQPKAADIVSISTNPEPPPPPAKRRGGDNVQSEDSPLAKSYRGWFLEYASYVILDRAVPHIDDGLKPVQRRILHTLWDMDDGRFHKVANIVGRTMSLHPHGDASIGAALVGIGQRAFLIEPQGNFGNTLTGDDAAAPRYIEARLTNFAKDVLFNPKTTTWQLSYDGRQREPVTLPAKFPIVLLDGAEGIAVGLATKILPHNFNDLCRAAVNHLQGKTFRIFPDFPTGGIADFSEYNDGERGGKVKIRAK
ncbi:MAG: DNA gyrase subunit A, partial [Opitutaceae bacterium]